MLRLLWDTSDLALGQLEITLLQIINSYEPKDMLTTEILVTIDGEKLDEILQFYCIPLGSFV